MVNYDELIKSISYSQHQILKDIINLWNDGEPFDADLTYSKGGFYKEQKVEGILIPEPKHKFDVVPQMDDVVKIEPLGKIPLGDSSIKSIVFDPPFGIAIGPSINSEDKEINKIIRRFASYYPVGQLLESYYHWIKESYRVLKDGGLLVMKTQPTVTGGKELNSQFYSWLVAEAIGFDLVDEFILLAKNRLHSGKIKKQEHARKFHSYFLVFKKNNSKKVRYFDWMSCDEVDCLLRDLKENNIKKKK